MKLKIKNSLLFPPSEEVVEMEHARYLLSSVQDGAFVLVEGHPIRSFEDVVKLAAGEQYKGREALEVWISPAVPGAG